MEKSALQLLSFEKHQHPAQWIRNQIFQTAKRRFPEMFDEEENAMIAKAAAHHLGKKEPNVVNG